jgi:hypothetical protein
MLWERLIGEPGGEPEMDSGGVVGSISKDSEEERPWGSYADEVRLPSGAGTGPSRVRPVSTGDLASVPDSTVLREEEASGG